VTGSLLNAMKAVDKERLADPIEYLCYHILASNKKL